MQTIVHPVTDKPDSPWTWTYVSSEGVTSTSRTFEKYDPNQTQERATELALKTWPATEPVVQDKPYKAVTTEDQAKARAANLAKARAAKADQAKQAKADAEFHAAEVQRIEDNLAKPVKRKMTKPGQVKAAAKAVTDAADDRYYPGSSCTTCGNPVERTGKRGRPPVKCLEHRNDKPVVVKATPKGVSSKPCVCCDGPVKTKGRGRPASYCDKGKCQKAKDKARQAKLVAA